MKRSSNSFRRAGVPGKRTSTETAATIGVEARRDSEEEIDKYNWSSEQDLPQLGEPQSKQPLRTISMYYKRRQYDDEEEEQEDLLQLTEPQHKQPLSLVGVGSGVGVERERGGGPLVLGGAATTLVP